MRGEIKSRLDRPYMLELVAQTECPEPPVRFNTDLLDADQLGSSETQAWDDLVAYYTS